MRGLLLLFVCTVMVGCGALEYQDIPARNIYTISNFPINYITDSTHYDFNLVVSRGDGMGAFSVNGTATPRGALSPGSYTDTTFVLYLTLRGKVTEVVHLLARPGDGGVVRLKKDFHTEKDFDGLSIRYSVKYLR